MPPSLRGNPPSHTVLHTPERTPTAAPALEELPQTDGTSARTFPATTGGISVRVSLAAQSWPIFVHGFQEKPHLSAVPTERDPRHFRCLRSRTGQTEASCEFPRKETALQERGHRHHSHIHDHFKLLKNESKIKNKWAAQGTFTIPQTA